MNSRNLKILARSLPVAEKSAQITSHRYGSLAAIACDRQISTQVSGQLSGCPTLSERLRFLTLPLVILVAGCATVSKPVTPETRKQMETIYHCVWFHHLNGDEGKSSAMIDEAVKTGEAAGLDGGQIMQIYSESRQVQKERVAIEASERAQKRGRTIKRLISGDNEPVEATEQEVNAALLDLYREQCS